MNREVILNVFAPHKNSLAEVVLMRDNRIPRYRELRKLVTELL